MTRPNPLTVLSLIEEALTEYDEIPPELSEQFLEIFTPTERVFLLRQAVRVALSLDKEEPCPTITPVPIV